MFRSNRGITLIALVITIIVLLILAGVSIAMLTGNNGILTQAQNATNTTETAEIKERINMELTALYSSVLAQEIPTEFTQEDFNSVKENLGTDYTVHQLFQQQVQEQQYKEWIFNMEKEKHP